MLICRIRLLYDLSFRLYRHITYIYRFFFFTILLHFIYFGFNVVCSYGVFFLYAIRRDSISLLKFPFFSHVQIFSCVISRIIIIIIIIPCEFLTPLLADDLSVEAEWHQVSSSLQDSSQYSDRS